MKNRVTQCLVMGALAIGITSGAIASEEHESASKNKQLCFQINGDINNSTQIDKIYLTVNSVGVATGNGCFYSISDPSATPSCSPLTGNLTGTFPEAFLSLTGNWQRTVGSEVVSEDTKVSVHYDFKKLSGEGIAKTIKSSEEKPAEQINSAEGSVTRIQCGKSTPNIASRIPPKFATKPTNAQVTLQPLTLSFPSTSMVAVSPSCAMYPIVSSCSTVNPGSPLYCDGRVLGGFAASGYVTCQQSTSTGLCIASNIACQ